MTWNMIHMLVMMMMNQNSQTVHVFTSCYFFYLIHNCFELGLLVFNYVLVVPAESHGAFLLSFSLQITLLL